MAQLSLVVTGNSSPSYTVSIKKTGDNTERFINQSGNTVYFTADEGNNEYTLSVIGCETETYTFNLNCTYSQMYNVFNNVAKETSPNTFSPEKFANITIPLVNDPYLSKSLPTFYVVWENYNYWWVNKGVTDLATRGFYSWRPISMNPCTEYWIGECGGDSETFISSFPYNRRFGHTSLSVILSNDFIANSPRETVYNYAKGNLNLGFFGRGDKIGNKTNAAVFSVDVETGLEVGGNTNDSAGLASLFAGMGDGLSGYVFAIYAISLFTYGHALPGRYPNPDGSFNTIIPNVEYPDINYAISKVWTDPFILNGETKYLKDYKNVIEVEEQSHYQEDSFEQGEILYNSAGTPLRTINHFGTVHDDNGISGYNVAHVISRSISLIETGVAFSKSQNRDYIPMFKNICDRGNDLYIWTDHTKRIDVPYPSYYIPRNIAFMGGMLLFLSGARGWHLFDYPRDGLNQDSYNGVLGALNYIFNNFTIAGNTISLASLKPSLNFNTWNTEQSYDGGTTWIKHKAIEWRNSTNYIPLRTAYTNTGYIIIFACRPYSVEPLSCKWRVNIGGTNYTGDITSNDWMSCYPVESPNRKDFYFKILKV